MKECARQDSNLRPTAPEAAANSRDFEQIGASVRFVGKVSPDEALLEVRLSSEVRYLCVLVDHGPEGTEAKFFRNSTLSHSQRFPTRQEAIRWAENEKAIIERYPGYRP